MVELTEVRIGIRPLDRFKEILPEEEVDRVAEVGRRIAIRFAKRVLWNVNSTAVGGGVAEMLPSLLAYTRSFGIDARWSVSKGRSRQLVPSGRTRCLSAETSISQLVAAQGREHSRQPRDGLRGDRQERSPSSDLVPPRPV